MLKIYSKTLTQKHYFTPTLSLTSVLALGFVAGFLIIPFAIAYVSGRKMFHLSIAFWTKVNSYQEQPKVLLQQNVFALLEGYSGTTPLQIFYSSEPAVTQGWIKHLINTKLLILILAFPSSRQILLINKQTWNVDTNADGLPDWFWINMTVPLSSSETIYHVRLAFTMKVTLSVG